MPSPVLLFFGLLSAGANGLDNGLALTPPMGWMTWERFRCTAADHGSGTGAGEPTCADDPENCIGSKLIEQHADIMSQPEWLSAGYKYINIDDCWANMARTADGKLVGNTTRFPKGMSALASYVHSKNLKLGTYNDVGTKTCGGYPGEVRAP